MQNKSIPLEKVIAECDLLFNSNRSSDVGEHLRLWRQKAHEVGDLSSELSLLSELMGHYRMQHDETRALAAVDDGLELLYQLHVDNTVSGGTILINAATALQSFGYFNEAIELYNLAMQWYTALLPANDRRLAGLYNNTAAAYDGIGESFRAEDFYSKALKILLAAGDLMDSAVTYVNLAQLYDRRPGAEKAVAEALDRAWECFDSPQAVRDGYYAHTCSKCASAFGMLGRDDIENELMRRAGEFYATH